MLHDFVIRTKKNYDLRWITTAVQNTKSTIIFSIRRLMRATIKADENVVENKKQQQPFETEALKMKDKLNWAVAKAPYEFIRTQQRY